MEKQILLKGDAAEMVSRYKEYGFPTMKDMVIHSLQIMEKSKHDPDSEILCIVKKDSMKIRRTI